MMAEDLNAHLQRVNALLASSQTAAALQAAAQALSVFPYSSDLLNLAGLCAATLGDYPRAERYWLQSIGLEPTSPRTLFNLALLNDNLQRKDQAERYYRLALELDPDNAAAHSNLGAVLAAARDSEQAEHCYRRAVVLEPTHAMAHYNLGLLLIECRRPSEAEGALCRAAAADPHHAPAWFQLGVLLAGTGRQAEAEHCYRHSIVLDPTHAMTYNNLGLLLAKRRQAEAAEQCYRMAFALHPDSASAFNNLGLLLETVAQDDEAERCYRRAIALEPQAPIAYSNLALLLARHRQDQGAEDYLRRALAVDRDYAVARLNLGYLLLRQGRFDEGWRHHEARLDPSLPAENRHPYPANAACPPWRGERLRGKSLLVWPEQGMGDEIQFCRYLPLLKRQGTARITLVCKAPLKALMETLEGVDAIFPATAAETPLTDHDYWTCPLSIPLYCRTGLTTIPAQLPYLHAPPEYVAKWTKRLPRDHRLKVGLVWKGSALHHNDAQRSLPDLGILAPLWSVPDVQFISLQKERDEEQALHPPAQQPLLALGHELEDFADSAAILSQLDLLISVDTAVAHLAGALAKPCWVMLPRRRCDWRWLQGRDDSPWYPGVMRLFRQPREGDWETVVAAVSEALRAWAARRTPA
jgi:tetratricopeptide (TPR) repeat protein